MIATLYAVRKLCGADYDLWAVNAEPDYREEKKEESVGTAKKPAFVRADAVPPSDGF